MKETLVELHVEALPEGGYLATSHQLPGLLAQGRTLAETLEIAQDVARKLLESHLEYGDALPDSLKELVDGAVDLSIPVSIG